jgi:hypothetical protein
MTAAGMPKAFVTSRTLYRLAGNDRTFAATNFQFVALRIFEEEGVIARAVIDANFGTF